jgi:NitT/TauT family transport system substrate-binding protein
MKRTFAFLLFLMMVVCALITGCTAAKSETESEPEISAATAESSETETLTLRIAGLKGPTSMGLVQVMEKAAENEAANTYEFTIAGSADEITPKLIQGDLDMAAVPANLASVLFNNTDGAIRLLAINTLGVLYLVEKGDSIETWSDLKGQTIYATGKGSTPEYTLRYLLSANGLDPDTDVTIEWKSEPTEVVSILQAEDTGIAMLPQPYTTVAQNSVDGLHIVLDLTEAWDALDNGSTLVTGVLVARTDFVEAHPEAVQAFLDEYKASTEFVNAFPAEAAQLIEKYDIVKAAVAEKALPYCNITFVSGSAMRPLLEGYLQVLYDQNPKAIGGALPTDAFYYE